MSELEFFEVSGPDGRLRIAVDDGSDEPQYMQSVVKCDPGTALFRIAYSVALASDPKRDALGLYWASKAAVKRALVVARKAVKEKASG